MTRPASKILEAKVVKADSLDDSIAKQDAVVKKCHEALIKALAKQTELYEEKAQARAKSTPILRAEANPVVPPASIGGGQELLEGKAAKPKSRTTKRKV